MSDFVKPSMMIDVPTTITNHTPSCHHHKVYADYILASYPPQIPWICSICGEEGTMVDSAGLSETYEQVKARFNKIDPIPI